MPFRRRLDAQKGYDLLLESLIDVLEAPAHLSIGLVGTDMPHVKRSPAQDRISIFGET